MSASADNPVTPKISPEDKARDEVCAEHGITPEGLEQLKKEVGKVEATKISGRWFVYRSLKRAELKQIRQGVQGGDELIQEEKIAARCLVLPKLTDMQLREDEAGIATTLTELVYNFSGYTPDAVPMKI